MRPVLASAVLAVLGLSQPAFAGAAPGYVANATCIGCHADQAAAWAKSDHAKAMAVATSTSVRGDFNDARFVHEGVEWRFFKRGEKYFVRTEGPDAKPGEFEIRYTFGVEPLQQYLVELPGGRFQALTVAWDTKRKVWIHLFPNEKAPPGDVLHWTGRYQNWNQMCAACHSTNLVKGYDAKTDGYRTTWSEIEVTCQSCHGPGEKHVAWARRAGKEKSAGGDDGLSVHFSRDTPETEIEVCAPCHARRSTIEEDPIPGQPFLDDYLPALLTAGLYQADGQQDGEVYTYGSFRQSRMYQLGVRCSDCHDPHSDQPRFAGNALCTQCHQPKANPRFPTAAGLYDDPKHTHHAAGSAGAQCITCHMPARNYMIVDARHDHSLRIPRPDLSLKLGTSNACNDCHGDKTVQWAADAVAKWYPDPRRGETHYGEVLAAGRSGERDAGPALAKLVESANQAAIVRATALDLLRGYGGDTLGARIAATRDADAMVRLAAAESLEQAPIPDRVAAVAPLLADPRRAVRITAARVLSGVPREQLGPTRLAAFDAALAELIAAQQPSIDTPAAHLNLGVIDVNTGHPERAEQHYYTALRFDPDFTPARANLVQLYAASGRTADAERELRAGLARTPNDGELQYMLGLLLSEANRLDEAALALGKAADLMPQRARVRYNYALALQHLGRRKEGEAALLQAQKLEPADPAMLYALAVLYVQEQRWSEALRWGEALLAVAPGDPQARQLVDSIRAHGAASK